MRPPYLLFIGDARDQLAAKTAQGVADWRPENCLGQLRLPGCQADLGLNDLSPADAAAAGASTLLVGVANAGGVLSTTWTETILEAIESGLDVASGLHMKLADVPELAEAAARGGRQLFDVRHPTQEFAVGTGRPRSGRRLLTVGTDCSQGKMYAALALEREMQSRGMSADFRATGQSGIFIAGHGVSIDAVVSDFVSGAVEWLCPDAEPGHWDIVEGQGSLFHPSYAGVSLGLLHGAQPDALVMCHEPTRRHMRGLPDWPLPDIAECIAANLAAASLTNQAVRLLGVAVNTSALPETEVSPYLEALEADLGVACVDPLKHGVGRLIEALP
ncbi:MAG TPA: N-acetyltransferase DgcN [Alphaproteobacteria bacterium]|jgi:uncharacterized NAD-dependent epimerase/dehydratase family protein|nr:DUF1611 domain-containing protein [Alphaproteobacteria bacterium]HJP22983.1 N-acetyltransferase DgcN [Alphaproteobacteria bacterium]